MRKMKKLAGLLLAMVMVLALGVTALAADTPTTYTITVTYEASGHTYEAYQIFTGDLYETYSKYTGAESLNTETQLYLCAYNATDDTYAYTAAIKVSDYVSDPVDVISGNVTTTGYYYVSGTVLSNIQWGSGVDSTKLIEALKLASDDSTSALSGKFPSTDNSGNDITYTAAMIAEIVATFGNDSAAAQEFAQLVSENLSNTAAGTSTQKKNEDDSYVTNSSGEYIYEITSLTAGYYLVKDKDGTVTAEGDSYTDIILQVVTDVAVTAKADTTTLDKTTQSTTDSTNETTADYDIGDDVPFTLTATLPSNFASYSEYKMTFHDTLSNGLSFNDSSVEVAVYTLCTNLTSFDSSTEYYTISNGTITKVDTSDADASSGTYYTKTVVASTGGYTVVKNKYLEITGISTFESGITYYTYDTVNDIYTAVPSGTNADSSETYYVNIHKVNISEFANGTTYYIYNSTNGSYEEVSGNATFDSTETYYVIADCTFEVQIDDAKKLLDDQENTIAVSSASTIVVTYTAELTDDAEVTESNTAYLEYSNNPNDDGTGKTPEDKTTVFSFTLDVNKVTKTSSNVEIPLEGAGFTLYKAEAVTISNDADFTPNTITYYIIGTDGKMTAVASDATWNKDTAYYVYTPVGSEVLAGYQQVTRTAFESGVTYYTLNTSSGEYEKVTDTSGTPNGTYYVKNQFIYKGLAVGYYKLVESTTPSGYNTMEDLYFTIEAVTSETGDVGEVESLTIKDVNENVISTGTDPAFNVSTTACTISTDIVNTKGSTLPSTGGIGTTIFYVIGTLMVFGAAVVLITRRRMKNAE